MDAMYKIGVYSAHGRHGITMDAVAAHAWWCHDHGIPITFFIFKAASTILTYSAALKTCKLVI